MALAYCWGEVKEGGDLPLALQTRNGRFGLFDPRSLLRLRLGRLLDIVLSHVRREELLNLLAVVVDGDAEDLAVSSTQ